MQKSEYTRLQDIDEATSFECLDTETLLDWLARRHEIGRPYGYIGDSLVAVNPCQQLGIYRQDDHTRYTDLRIRGRQPAHIFWVADHVYQCLVDSGEDQCVVVSGDSGAGKTESTKFILNHLVRRETDKSDLVERLEQVNPLIELFGNAATVLNSNSSRFGKLVELEYDPSGCLGAAKIECFILEKFRVTSRNSSEKNFHAFYALFAGMSPQRLEDLNLDKNADLYRILKSEDEINGVFNSPEDKNTYRQYFLALEKLLYGVGFSDEDVNQLYRVLASILLIANIEFGATDDDTAEISNWSEQYLANAADSLDLDEDTLVEALLTVKTWAGGEEMIRHKTVRQASDGRDAAARELYSSLFYGIIDKINQKLSGGVNTQKTFQIEGKGNCVRLLDISGFENVSHNGFEQLLINAANERLHAYFLSHTFRLERQEYETEGVDLMHVDFLDNTPILELIFKKPYGIFPLVDDQLSLPNSSDRTFLQSADKYNEEHEKYVRTTGQAAPMFGIKHYAGQVMYNASGFLEKNSDTLPNNLKEAVEESANVFVQDYFLLGSRTTMAMNTGGRSSMRHRNRHRGHIPTTFANGRQGQSTGRLTGRVTEKFKTSLDHMMTKLSTTKPVFVRCIKPNIHLKPKKFDSRLVREQLKCSGLLEVATVRKAGYPIRVPYIDFAQRYASIIEGKTVASDPKVRCRAIIDETTITNHQFGKTKVFLKMDHRDVLEAVVAQKQAEKEAAEIEAREKKEAERRAREEAKKARNLQRSPSAGSDSNYSGGEGSTAILDNLTESGLGTRSSSQEDLGTIAEEETIPEEEEEEKEEVPIRSASSEDNLKDVPSYLAFRVTERDFEHNNDFEMKVRRACRFLAYILLSTLVLASGTSSVISLIWVAKSVPQKGNKSFSTTLTMLCQLIPVIIMWISCLIKSCFGRKEWPTFKAIIGICFMDILQCAGRSILLFKVYPTVSPLECVLLGLAVFQFPAFMKGINHCFQKHKAVVEDKKTKRKKRLKFSVVLVLLIFAFLVQMGAIPVLIFKDMIYRELTSSFTVQDIWPVLLFAFLTTIGWWENYFYGVLVFGKKHVHPGVFRKNVQRIRDTSYIYSGLIQIPLITMLPQALISDQQIMVFEVLEALVTSYAKMWTTKGIEIHFSTYGLLYIQIITTFICTYCSGIACRLYMQRFAFALPLVIIPVASAVISTLCVPVNYLKPWDLSTICSVSPKTDSIDFYVTMAIGGAMWISYLIVTNHIWFPDIERMAKTDRLFVFNHRDGIFPHQSLAARRRDDCQVKRERHHKVKKGEEEKIDCPMVYICATMWHETRQEMVQLLKSLFRLDFDNCARRIAADKFLDSNIDNYDAEIHIIFDDAYQTDPDSKQRVVNSYVRLLLEVMPEAVTSVAKGRMELNSFDKIVTPYGGRLSFEMPGGTMFNIHLKDKEKIRHKKRWSQIMYLYYLLGHKLVGQTYKTVEDLIKDKVTSDVDGKTQAKERKRKRHRVRPFTSLLNNLPDDVVRRAENVFIMTLDGDVDFRPDSVRLLIDRMKKNKKVAAVCGRIHPIGDGPMVWYQQFEYAVGHWLQKAAEHVFGCVMCCPGCFSLFRGSALMDDNVMRMYATEPTEARHYVQYEQGEDRWLCTLLLQQGWKIDYCAGSDAFTYAPETFNDFYIQRRRWSPSTIANIMDLLGSWRTTVNMNDNISTLFMGYQFFLMASSIIAPGTVVFMIAGSYNAVLGVNMWQGYLMSVIPVLCYILLCLKAKTSTQVRVAAIMSALYAIVMMIVTVGTVINIVSEDFFTPNVLFLVGLSLVFVITGLIHPKELMCLFHGILYYLTVPSTFVFLTVFFLCNLNVVSWGTREGPVKVNPAEELEQEQQAKKGKIRKFIESLGIASLIQDIKSFMYQVLGNNKGERSTPLQGLTPQTSVSNLSRMEVARPDKPKKERPKKVVLDETHWIKDIDGDTYRAKYLEEHENKFWKTTITEFLLPLKANKEQQEKIKTDLLSARNNVVFAYFLLNLMFTLVILQLQLKQDLLKETFFIAGKYEPVSVVFLASFSLLLIIQFSGSLAHQWGTFLHLIASTRINWFRGNDDDRKSLDAIREAQRLQSAFAGAEVLPDYDDDDDYSDTTGSTQQDEVEAGYNEEEPDYSDEDEPPSQHISQYERNFQKHFRTVRRHFDRNPRFRPQIPTVSRSYQYHDMQRRHDLYRSTVRRHMRPEQYDPPDYDVV